MDCKTIDIADRRKITVKDSYDVIVVGGGIAGISASVAASRAGSKTLLIEKGIVLGGLATAGLISWYEPLCDGEGKEMIGGIAEELIRLSVKYGFNDLPEKWGGSSTSRVDGRYSTHFSPMIFAMTLDEYLKDNKVNVLFDCLMTYPVMNKNICSGIVVEAKEGKLFFPAKAVVDATGDASVFAAAGAPTICGDNYQSYCAQGFDRDAVMEYLRTNDLVKMRKWMVAGVNLFVDETNESKQKVSGVTADEITGFVLEGRSKFFEIVKKQNPENRDISMIPFMPQFRTIRRIVGEEDFLAIDGQCFDNAIGSCGDFRANGKGKHYQIPYTSLINSNYPNLFAAGRIISSPAGNGWEVSRVIPVCALTGQASGVAAAMTANRDNPVKNIRTLQKKLANSGVVFFC